MIRELGFSHFGVGEEESSVSSVTETCLVRRNSESFCQLKENQNLSSTKFAWNEASCLPAMSREFGFNFESNDFL